MTVRELKGWCHVFEDTKGHTIRLFSHKEIHISDDLVSNDMRAADEKGFIKLLPDEVASVPAVENYSKKRKNNQSAQEDETKGDKE